MSELVEGLERLSGLREQGHISDAEFENAKARLLGEQPEPADETEWEPGSYRSSSRKPVLLSIAGIALFAGAGAGGWIWAHGHAAAIPPNATVATDGLNCHSQADLSSAVSEVLEGGSAVHIGSDQNGWSKVEGHDCWVKTNRLKTAATPTAGEPIKPATDSALSAQSADASTLLVGDYDFYRNPEQGIIDMAQSVISSGNICVGEAPESGYTMYAYIDPQQDRGVIRAFSGFAGPQPDSRYDVKIDRLSLNFDPDDKQKDTAFSLKFTGMRMKDNHQLVLFAKPDNGPVYDWWFYCGKNGQGTKDWQDEYNKVTNLMVAPNGR